LRHSGGALAGHGAGEQAGIHRGINNDSDAFAQAP
jgi:hypothetical protein